MLFVEGFYEEYQHLFTHALGNIAKISNSWQMNRNRVQTQFTGQLQEQYHSANL